MPSPTERKARGLDQVARDEPSDNLMLKSGASWLTFTPRGPGPGGKEKPEPSTGPGAGGLTSKLVTYGQHPRRG